MRQLVGVKHPAPGRKGPAADADPDPSRWVWHFFDLPLAKFRAVAIFFPTATSMLTKPPALERPQNIQGAPDVRALGVRGR
jgi:hypothetical protein